MWSQTYTSKQFWLLDPDPSDVCIEDIAHALSLQCRFNGHCREFYSVADHSIRVSRLVPPEHAMVGLMHDATEAYTGDVTSPMKRVVPEFEIIESKVWAAIAHAFGLPLKMSPEVKQADLVMLSTEARDLMGPRPAKWMDMPEPLDETIRPMSPDEAEAAFLLRFEELTGER